MTDTANGVALVPSVEAGVVNALQHECGETSESHGFKNDWHIAARLEEFADSFFEGEHKKLLIDAAVALRNNILAAKLALIHSEISEALESLRKNGGAQGALDGQGNFGEELADAMVRILDTGTFTKDNLGDELLHKMKVNQGRPHMHGKVM